MCNFSDIKDESVAAGVPGYSEDFALFRVRQLEVTQVWP